VNVLLCSSKFINGDIEYNANKMIELLKKKSENRIDFLFFGESFLNGFEALTWDYYKDLKMKEKTDSYLKVLSEKCIQYNRGLGFGYFEYDNGKIYSSYIIYDNNGNTLINYRRITSGWRYPNVDTSVYTEGQSIASFLYNNKKIGIGLCGDIWHEPLYGELLNQNFDVFIWPVYVNYSIDKWNEDERTDYMLRSRSLGQHVLYINSVSDEPSFGGTYFQANAVLIEETVPSSEEYCLLCRLDDFYDV